jgi:hypothetical protein
LFDGNTRVDDLSITGLNGVSFAAQKESGREQTEFVVSRDMWFRPIEARIGPDGALYFLEWQNPIIGHMQHNLRDPNRDHQRGRIYRIVPTNFKRRPLPMPGKASTKELVALLEHPNGWHRDTAARLLYERQDKTAVALLTPGTVVPSDKPVYDPKDRAGADVARDLGEAGEVGDRDLGVGAETTAAVLQQQASFTGRGPHYDFVLLRFAPGPHQATDIASFTRSMARFCGTVQQTTCVVTNQRPYGVTTYLAIDSTPEVLAVLLAGLGLVILGQLIVMSGRRRRRKSDRDRSQAGGSSSRRRSAHRERSRFRPPS